MTKEVLIKNKILIQFINLFLNYKLKKKAQKNKKLN